MELSGWRTKRVRKKDFTRGVIHSVDAPDGVLMLTTREPTTARAALPSQDDSLEFCGRRRSGGGRSFGGGGSFCWVCPVCRGVSIRADDFIIQFRNLTRTVSGLLPCSSGVGSRAEMFASGGIIILKKRTRRLELWWCSHEGRRRLSSWWQRTDWGADAND